MKFILIFLSGLFLGIINLQSQNLDSLVANYNDTNELLQISLYGSFHSIDPDGIYATNYTYANNTFKLYIDFSVCGTWPAALKFDTTFNINVKLNPGILFGEVSSFNVQNLDTNDCRFNGAPRTKLDSLFFTLNVPLSVQEHLYPVAIHPNPTHDFINIPETYLHKKFLITDVLGRSCMEGILSEERLNLAALKPGQYILIIEGVKPIKIMKE